MTKKIIIIVIVVCVIFATLLATGLYLGIRWSKKNLIRFTIRDTLPEGNGKKAHVILLAGQSNAAGCSLNRYLQQNVSEEEYAAYEAGYDNVYINYFSTGFNPSEGFVKTSPHQGDNVDCFGPEVGLAAKLHEQYPNELFFIVKFAWSGTDLFSQWLSPSSDGKTGYLYRNFVRYVKKNMKYLRSKGYDVEIEGLCWMQGESDSFSVENGKGYELRLKNFIADLRKDLAKYASDDGIAFVDAYIAANPVYWVYCDLVNQSKKAVADSSEMNVVIDTNACGLVCDQEPEENPDRAHYDSLSQIKLGNLFAEQIARFLD